MISIRQLLSRRGTSGHVSELEKKGCVVRYEKPSDTSSLVPDHIMGIPVVANPDVPRDKIMVVGADGWPTQVLVWRKRTKREKLRRFAHRLFATLTSWPWRWRRRDG